MSDVGEVAQAVSSVTDLVSNILDRADRDAPEKQYHDAIIKIQNAFANNSIDSDEFRVFVDELCNRAGIAITPQRDISGGKREYLHASLCIIAQSIRDKQLLTKAIFTLQKK